ncbi:acyltransferase family protein [Rhodococcoides fascians]|uniref:acyltransferase family protein n=1 Tax=Rhodococcoides fascians TaxID=1828 RepID=UPI0018AF75DF|nr:acyltransferase [Rhodococcus fascians]
MNKKSSAIGQSVSPSGRVQFLDGVRGLASFLVLIGHSMEAADPWWGQWQTTLNLGRVGIVAFFLVSGYVVALSLNHQSLTVFWIRRFFRLYPIFWITLAIYLVVDWPASSERYSFSFVTIVLNILMIQGFVSVASMLWPTWTLGSELAFYGQQSILKAYASRFFAHVGWFWLFIFALMCFSTRLTDLDLTAISPLMMFTASVGITFYERDRGNSRNVWPYILACVTVVPVLGWVLQGDAAAFPSSNWSALGFNVSYIAGLVVFLIFYSLRDKGMPKVLTWLGSISYVLYLVHAIVIRVLERLDIEGAVIVWITVPVSLVASAVMHRWIEQPFINFGRSISKRFSARKKPDVALS